MDAARLPDAVAQPVVGAVPLVWGIVNVTPDSFSDGGRYATRDQAVAHGLALAAAGADVLDVGGESTRPGAAEVPVAVEIERVGPVIEGLRAAGITQPISVDTRKAPVARAALAAGATLVNDVSAGTHDPDLLPAAAEYGAGVVLMHMQGRPETMQDQPAYVDVLGEIRAWLAERADRAEAAGVAAERILVDPGIGFGKTLEHNVEIFHRLEELCADGRPVLLGASRKSFLGRLTGHAVGDRLPASLACAVRAAEAGVSAVRVHDVGPTVDLLRVLRALRGT